MKAVVVTTQGAHAREGAGTPGPERMLARVPVAGMIWAELAVASGQARGTGRDVPVRRENGSAPWWSGQLETVPGGSGERMWRFGDDD